MRITCHLRGNTTGNGSPNSSIGKCSPNPTLYWCGYYFYKEQIALSPEDEAKLQSLIVTIPPFKRLSGGKQCFGFHPDFMLEWTDSARNLFDALICCDCGEAKLYGPSIRLYCDLGGPSSKPVKDLLFKYYRNLPESERRGHPDLNISRKFFSNRFPSGVRIDSG